MVRIHIAGKEEGLELSLFISMKSVWLGPTCCARYLLIANSSKITNKSQQELGKMHTDFLELYLRVIKNIYNTQNKTLP